MASITAPSLRKGLARVRRPSAAHTGAVLILVIIAAVVVVPIVVIAAGSFWSASFIGLPGSLTTANSKTTCRRSLPRADVHARTDEFRYQQIRRQQMQRNHA